MAYTKRNRASQAESDLVGFIDEEPEQAPDELSMSVTQLNKSLKSLIEGTIRRVNVVGEISGFTVHNGHGFFDLKDPESKIPAVMWKSVIQRTPFQIKNGLKVVCSANLEVYVTQGKYQLSVSKMIPVGVGVRELQFRALQEKLRAEGLFAESRKRSLPPFISRVGVVTSPSAAAFRDFINTLRTRCPYVQIVLIPTRVQGEFAAREIAQAFDFLNRYGEAMRLDAVALIRGGGSVEDLWCFNEEISARAVASSVLPVITGIGHEIDVSICDLTADVRRVTPTAVATLIEDVDTRFERAIDEAGKHIARIVEADWSRAGERLQALTSRPIFKDPLGVISSKKADLLSQTEDRLTTCMESLLERRQASFREAVGRLEALSPLAVLSRGYSITRDLTTGRILTKGTDARNGAILETRLEDGVLHSLLLDGGRSVYRN